MKKKLLLLTGFLLLISFSILNLQFDVFKNNIGDLSLLIANKQAIADGEVCVGEICFYYNNMTCYSCYPDCPDEPCDQIDDHWKN